MAKSDFHDDQQVWLIEPGHERRIVTVSTVGRTLAQVDLHGGGVTWPFYLDTGYEKRNGTAGIPRQIRTLDQQAAIDRRTAADRALSKAGITVNHDRRNSMPVETMEAIALMAEHDQAPEANKPFLPADVHVAIATLQRFAAEVVADGVARPAT